MKTKWNPLLLIGMIGIFTIGSKFAAKYIQAVWGDKNIWWTPVQMALPINETKDDFAIFLSGKPLQHHIDQGTLTAMDKSGKPYQVVTADIKARINKWNETKASLLHWAIYFALGLGSCVTLFGIGMAQWLSQRRQDNRA